MTSHHLNTIIGLNTSLLQKSPLHNISHLIANETYKLWVNNGIKQWMIYLTKITSLIFCNDLIM